MVLVLKEAVEDKTGTNLKIDIISSTGLVASDTINCDGIINKFFVSENKVSVFVTLTDGGAEIIRQINIDTETGSTQDDIIVDIPSTVNGIAIDGNTVDINKNNIIDMQWDGTYSNYLVKAGTLKYVLMKSTANGLERITEIILDSDPEEEF